MPEGPAESDSLAPASSPAWLAAQTRDWPAYFARMAAHPPRDTLRQAIAAFAAGAGVDSFHGLSDPSLSLDGSDEPPLAIDLGCGSGADTAELLRHGWRVLAIDGHADAFAHLLRTPGVCPSPRLTMQAATFEQLASQPRPFPRCRLLNASFALPFCPPHCFEALWRAALASVEPGGRFAGQLFGEHDSWAALPDRTHHTREGALALLEGWVLERFDEERRPSKAGQPAKDWHVFHIVARRPDDATAG